MKNVTNFNFANTESDGGSIIDHICMYYGVRSAVSVENPANLWSGYKLVCHPDNEGTDSTGTYTGTLFNSPSLQHKKRFAHRVEQRGVGEGHELAAGTRHYLAGVCGRR